MKKGEADGGDCIAGDHDWAIPPNSNVVSR